MPEYRRVLIPGSTYFFTIVTFNRAPIFLNPKARRILHDAWLDVTSRFPFTTDAVCLLPDHIHTLITLPAGDSNYPMRIREIKRLFTKSYLATIGPGANRNESREKKQEAAIWQRRYWEHLIRDEQDLHNHFDYIHYNPVKHGLVDRAVSWKWSSFHRYVKMGWYAADWGHGFEPKDKQQQFGE